MKHPFPTTERVGDLAHEEIERIGYWHVRRGEGVMPFVDWSKLSTQFVIMVIWYTDNSYVEYLEAEDGIMMGMRNPCSEIPIPNDGSC